MLIRHFTDRKLSTYVRTSHILCRIKPILRCKELILYQIWSGGLTRFARPFGAACSRCSRSVQLAAPAVEPRSGLLIPPEGCYMRKKKPVLAYELFLKYGGEGGIDSLRSPSGQIPRRLVICPTGCRQLSNPRSGLLTPPAGVICEKKSPYLRTSSS